MTLEGAVGALLGASRPLFWHFFGCVFFSRPRRWWRFGPKDAWDLMFSTSAGYRGKPRCRLEGLVRLIVFCLLSGSGPRRCDRKSTALCSFVLSVNQPINQSTISSSSSIRIFCRFVFAGEYLHLGHDHARNKLSKKSYYRERDGW